MALYERCLLYYGDYDECSHLYLGNSNECIAYFNKVKKYLELAREYWEEADRQTEKIYEKENITDEDLENTHAFLEKLPYYEELSNSGFIFYSRGIRGIYLNAFINEEFIDITEEMGIRE